MQQENKTNKGRLGHSDFLFHSAMHNSNFWSWLNSATLIFSHWPKKYWDPKKFLGPKFFHWMLHVFQRHVIRHVEPFFLVQGLVRVVIVVIFDRVKMKSTPTPSNLTWVGSGSSDWSLTKVMGYDSKAILSCLETAILKLSKKLETLFHRLRVINKSYIQWHGK